MSIIALISCTKRKQGYACPAKELYSKSNLFRHSYRYAGTITDKIYILSAKHGLVDENTIIEPYDETLLDKSSKEKEEWAVKVAEALSAESDLDNDEYVILAGKIYYEKLLPKFKKYRLPLEGVSLFERPGVLKELLGKGQSAGEKKVGAPVRRKTGPS